MAPKLVPGMRVIHTLGHAATVVRYEKPYDPKTEVPVRFDYQRPSSDPKLVPIEKLTLVSAA